MKTHIERAAAYLAKLPPAIAGQGGHAATFAAACRLVEFGLSFELAAPLLASWNETHCQPRWTETELRHKLADAFKRTSPKPYLSNGAAERARLPFSPMSRQRTSNQSASNRILARNSLQKCDHPDKTGFRAETVTHQADCDAPGVTGPVTVTPARSRIPAPKTALPERNAISDARCRSATAIVASHKESELTKLAPEFRIGTPEDFAPLAALRGLSIAGVALASARGILRFGHYHGQSAWIVLDASQRNACARRMDGAAWLNDSAKSFILRGSQAAWPIGIGEAQNFRNVLLCEGAPDLMAAFHFITAQGREADCAPVGVLSAAYHIAADALPLFTGKRVRIYAHDDETGYRAASRWTAQLSVHGANVDAFSFAGLCTRAGAPVKDLNGFAQSPDENLLKTLLP